MTRIRLASMPWDSEAWTMWDRLETAETLAGGALRRSLQRAAAGLRGVSRLLVSKAAERALGGEQRAALVADTVVVTSEIQALAAP